MLVLASVALRFAFCPHSSFPSPFLNAVYSLYLLPLQRLITSPLVAFNSPPLPFPPPLSPFSSFNLSFPSSTRRPARHLLYSPVYSIPPLPNTTASTAHPSQQAVSDPFTSPYQDLASNLPGCVHPTNLILPS